MKTSLASPGFVHVFVIPETIGGERMPGFDQFEGGAGADVETLTQGVGEPEGYEEFHRSQREIIASFKPEFVQREKVFDKPGFDVYDVKISAPGRHGENYPASGYLSIPTGAKPHSLPLRVSFLGYGVAGAPLYCDEGFIRLSLNVHGIDNGREQAYYDELSKGRLRNFGFRRDWNADPETCYFADMELRDLAAIKAAQTLPEYDGSGVHLIGGSMGAMRATNCASDTDNVLDLEVNVPWMCDLGGVRVGRLRGWRPDDDFGVRFFDTASAAKYVTCPVKIMCGLGDYVCPPSGVTAYYHNFRTPKSLRYVQNLTHPYRPAEEIGYTVREDY